jgi:hypothetical protein
LGGGGTCSIGRGTTNSGMWTTSLSKRSMSVIVVTSTGAPAVPTRSSTPRQMSAPRK